MAGIMRRAARYRAAQDIPESYRDRLVEWAAGEMHAPPAANTGALAYTLPSKRTTDV
jgi:hypothetical protein